MREIKFRCWDKKRKQMYDVIGMSRYYSDKSMQPSWIGKLHKKMTPTCQPYAIYGIKRQYKMERFNRRRARNVVSIGKNKRRVEWKRNL